MISVVIPTFNSEAKLAKCFSALVPATIEGLVRQVVVADGGSTDATLKISEASGADIVSAKPGRGSQIAAGISAARSPWLLVLHSDTVLEANWQDDAAKFMESADLGHGPARAAAFRFALDDTGAMPRLVETFVHWRSSMAKLPYGDQGLLISRRLHDEIGGYRQIELMEDIDIVRRIGRRRMKILRARAMTSPERFVSDGYLSRIARNQACLVLYAFGVPPSRIAGFYHGRRKPPQNACAPAETKPAASKPITPS